MKCLSFICGLFLVCNFVFSQNSTTVKIALLKYNGGGDWYANSTSLPNLVKYCNNTIKTNISEDIQTVEVGSNAIFNYPFIHLTGHGNIIFSNDEARNLRKYLMAGGFLHADDNYGIDKFFRREMKKVFPNIDFIELPFEHKLFRQEFKFPQGLPKIHEHNKKRPQAFALYYKNRIVCLYTYESDLGDGWEDESVHDDPKEIREKALKMGANIISYVFQN